MKWLGAFKRWFQTLKTKNRMRRYKKRNTFKHPIYGTCYYPNYYGGEIDASMPNIYNKDGKKIDTFFIRDEIFAHVPYSGGGALSKDCEYFLWDRYNFALQTHFYTGNLIVQTMGKPQRKFAWLLEPRSILLKSYDFLELSKTLASEFEAIITQDERVLECFDNAKFLYSYGVWCYNEKGDILKPSENKFEIKDKNISMVVSGKTLTKIHLIRNAIADRLKNDKRVDIFGAYVNRKIKFKSQSLERYRYQIVIENEISDYYFTEKILDCFISQCVPIYMGARKISQFFNINGIIEISPKDVEKLDIILKNCNEKDYLQRLGAIKDNYYRSLDLFDVNKNLYEQIILGT